MKKKQLINKTLDMRHYKLSLALVAIMTLFLLLFFVFALFSPDKNIVAAPSAVILLVAIPTLIYYIHKIRSILREPECYELYDALATKSHYAFGRRGARYFELEVTDRDGQTFYLETKGVFSNSFISPAYYKEYEQQKIQILYDRVSGTVLVIDKTEP